MDTLASVSVEYTNHIAFIICALIGGFAHYLKKFLRKETEVGLFQWFGKSNLAASLYTLIVFVFTMIGALAMGIVNSQMELFSVLYTGFVTGFAIDAGFNSDAKITDSLKDVKNDLANIKDPTKE